ncbi:MAG: hypothetical protein Q9216_004718 [Gyalolechia sp. 2 TL-2023]
MLASSSLTVVKKANSASAPSSGRRRNGGVQQEEKEKAMKCPECEVQLTAADLRRDPILVRKIRRIEVQERREREGDGDDDDDDRDHDDDDDEDVRAPGGRNRRKVEEVTSSPAQSRGLARTEEEAVKKERMSGVQKSQEGSREPSMVPATQIVDLGEGDEDDG